MRQKGNLMAAPGRKRPRVEVETGILVMGNMYIIAVCAVGHCVDNIGVWLGEKCDVGAGVGD